jgi:hypothetical protein
MRTYPKRRFQRAAKVGNPYVLSADHPAVVEGRTLFRARVVTPDSQLRLLKSGEHNKKIGSHVTKGLLKGAAIYTLTLEERATCPASCSHWFDCMGNQMNWSKRIAVTDDLLPRLHAELTRLQEENEAFLVRLHVLGEFYSVEYVEFWQRQLHRLPGLYLYGYTARYGCEIAGAIDILNMHPRASIRWSDGGEGEFRAVTVSSIEQAREAGVIVCPAQAHPKADHISCGSCALCWSTPKAIGFLRH